MTTRTTTQYGEHLTPVERQTRDYLANLRLRHDTVDITNPHAQKLTGTHAESLLAIAEGLIDSLVATRMKAALAPDALTQVNFIRETLDDANVPIKVGQARLSLNGRVEELVRQRDEALKEVEAFEHRDAGAGL